jgi:hypothetical protein
VATAAALTTTQGTAVSLTLAATDSDGDTLTYAIMTQPANGTISGTVPNLTYTPSANYTGSDSFTFVANDGTINSLPATVTIQIDVITSGGDGDDTNTGDWVAPIGIPTPTFGLTQSHTLYASATYDFGNGAEAYKNAGDGPYTYYVDNTSASATDTNNTYGTKDKPRKTIPTSYLKAGSVVEIHGGPYTTTVGGVLPLCGSGTATAPVFFRGPSSGTKPNLTPSVRVRGQYIVIENLHMVNCALTASSGITVSNVAVRNCEISGGSGNALYASSYNGDTITNILFYKNLIHDKGDVNSTTDEDAGGIACTAGVSYCWIVDNEIYNTSGSGVQIVSGSYSTMSTTHHIYVGRNLVHRTRQSGIWSKQSVDCVFSENTVYSVINTSWSPSKGLGYQYGPERLWIINNHVYDCTFGIAAMSSSGLGYGTEAFIMGNVIHDIHHMNDGTGYFVPNSSWSNAGIMLVGVAKNYIVNNSIYDADAGINSPSSGSLYIANNIISNITESACQHVFLESSAAMSSSTVTNNVFYQNGNDVRIRWGLSKIYSLPAFQAATGKGTNCVNADPKYVDPANGDLHVQSGSPAIDKGITSELYNRYEALHGVSIKEDFDGTSRPQNGTWDIGAYEFQK